MTRIVAAVFAGLTALAGYATLTNTGVADSSYQAARGAPSVRNASVHRGTGRAGGFFGGSRRGK